MKHLKIYENIDNKKLTIMRAEDWEGVYYDGKLLSQGHGVQWNEVLWKLGYTVESNNLTDDHLEVLGWNLPEKLEDVQKVIDSKKYNI